MNLILKYAALVMLLIDAPVTFGQVFGGNAPSVKWRQINTHVARIIFPAELDSTAERIINIINYLNLPMKNTIGRRSGKISIVLQNHTTISNGYVGLGPFRSEFLTTPLQNSFELGSLPWPDQLTVHEFRHVQQYNNFNVGLAHVMYKIFGDEGLALATNACIPNWFFEGDAVYNETNVSRQGRGSLPFFYNGYRALWKDGKNYNWMKLRNGSYKDFVPDHYNLGFMLVAYGREKYGDQFWENVTRDAASFKGLFYPFQKAVKKYSGKNYITFRNDALDFFKAQFDFKKKSPLKGNKKESYRDEEYPFYIGTDSILFVKSSFKLVPEFIIRVNNKERKVRTRAYSIDNQFSYKNGKIVYASYRPNIRWGYSDYSDLHVLDIANSKEYTLTKHTKYFSPDITQDGKRIIAVNEKSNISCSLNLIDALSGNLIKVIPNKENLFYTYPKFFNDSEIVSAVRNPSGRMSLAIINIESGQTNYLVPFSYNVIGFPSIVNDTLYFSYSYHKNDELFAYTFLDKKLWEINYEQQKGIGKYQPSVNRDKIIWSAFTAEGYRLQEVAKKAVTYEEKKPEILDKNTSSFGITVLQNTNSNLLYGVPNDTFPIKKYSKAFHLLNFHSVEPNVNDPEYSLTLLGENVLNTFQSQASFTYNRSEKYKKIGLSGTYGALFPFLSAGVNYTFDRQTLYHTQQISFDELEPYAGFSIPLNLSKGRSFTYLTFGSQYVYNQSNFKGLYKDSLGAISYSYSSNFFSFSHQVQTAIQQIFPRFAQAINVSYKTPFSKYHGFEFLVNGNLYIRGFMRTHSIVLNGAYLKKDTLGQINFSSGFPFSRGYSSVNLYQMCKWGIDYDFPLLYPDAGFADVFYLLRVRANLFYDYTKANDFYANGNRFNASFRSTGTEIYFDTKWWNEANVSIGVRYSRLLDNDLFGGSGRNRWEIILPVNIFNQ